jgi:hypothetical protein
MSRRPHALLEQSEVHAACAIALEDQIAHVPTPHWEPLAFTLLEIAPGAVAHRF